MKFCRFCGKELINGQCDCIDFLAENGCTEETEEPTNERPWIRNMKNKEPFAINSINLDFSSLSGFVSSMRDQTGMSEPASNNADPFERDVPIVPDCVQPEENEVVVKQYNIAKLRTRLKFMKAEGRLMVTNRRLLFRATGTSPTGNIAQEHQFDLDKIAGMEMHKDYKFSFLNFFGVILLAAVVHFLLFGMLSAMDDASRKWGYVIFCLLFGLAGLVPFFLLYKKFWLKLVCGCVSTTCLVGAAVIMQSKFFAFLGLIALVIQIINVVIICFVPNFVMKIKSGGAEGAIVIGSKKVLFARQTGDDYSGFAEVLPWEDTIMAMNELGTLIDDLQKHGDYAIEKWTR